MFSIIKLKANFNFEISAPTFLFCRYYKKTATNEKIKANFKPNKQPIGQECIDTKNVNEKCDHYLTKQN